MKLRNFSFEIIIWSQYSIQSPHILKFKNFKRPWIKKWQNQIFDLEELYKFVVYNLFIWTYLSKENFIWTSHTLKFKIIKWPWMVKQPKPNLKYSMISATFLLKPFSWIHLRSQKFISKSSIVNTKGTYILFSHTS